MTKRTGPLINIDFGWLETLILLSASGIGGLLILLVVGLNKGKPVAFAVVGGLVTLGLILLGGGLVLLIMWFAYLMERGREKREQERWIDNSKENMALMHMTAKAQAQQNQMLLRQGRELARALPSPDDALDVDALVFDNAIFDELEN